MFIAENKLHSIVKLIVRVIEIMNNRFPKNYRIKFTILQLKLHKI